MSPKEKPEPLRAIVQEQSKKIDEMYFAIMGNEKAGVDGLAQKVQAHSKYISADKKLKWTLSGIFTGANIGFWAWVKNHLGI